MFCSSQIKIRMRTVKSKMKNMVKTGFSHFASFVVFNFVVVILSFFYVLDSVRAPHH